MLHVRHFVVTPVGDGQWQYLLSHMSSLSELMERDVGRPLPGPCRVIPFLLLLCNYCSRNGTSSRMACVMRTKGVRLQRGDTSQGGESDHDNTSTCDPRRSGASSPHRLRAGADPGKGAHSRLRLPDRGRS